MTIGDLLDVWDINREHDNQIIKIMDENGKSSAQFCTNSSFLYYISDKEISRFNVSGVDEIEVWLVK